MLVTSFKRKILKTVLIQQQQTEPARLFSALTPLLSHASRSKHCSYQKSSRRGFRSYSLPSPITGIFSRYSEIVRNSSVRALLFLKKRMHSYLFWSGSLQSFWRLRFSFPHCPAYEYSVMFFSSEPCSSLFGIRRISGVRCCYSKLLKYLISGSLREDHCYPQARAHNLPVLWLHQAS